MRGRTVAVCMARDEEDVIGTTVGHMLTQVDTVLVADNLSTDGTRAILDKLAAEHPGRLRILDDEEPAYRQSEKTTALALHARLHHGAEWVVPFDADEVWYSPWGRIGDVLADVGAQWLVVPAPLFDHVATALDDPLELDPVRRLGWRRVRPAPLRKVAVRWRQDLVIHQGNHGATYEGRATVFDELLVVRHFPYRTPEQLCRKVRNGAAAYAAAGESISKDTGAHWRQWGELLDHHGPSAIAELFETWYWRASPRSELVTPDGGLQPPLIYDPAPVA